MPYCLHYDAVAPRTAPVFSKGTINQGKSNVNVVLCTGTTDQLNCRRADVRVVCWWVWMVVWFVCVIRVPLCARVSRVCPGSLC